MHTFFAPDIETDNYNLSPAEAQHAIKVLRMKEGQRLYLIDGKGNRYLGEISYGSSKTCNVNIIDVYHEPRKSVIKEIAIAPPKTSARLDFMLEKLTELNITKITLFRSENSERKKINPERLQKTIISALKQSGNLYMPEIATMPTFNEVISQDFSGNRMIAHCYDTPKIHVKEAIKDGVNTQILIGPEGDFSESEVNDAQQHNFIPITLTQQRLRTETAAIFAGVLLDLI